VLIRNCSVYSSRLVKTPTEQTDSFYIRSNFLPTSDAPPFQNDEDDQSTAQVYDAPAVFLHPVLGLVFRQYEYVNESPEHRRQKGKYILNMGC